MEKLFLVLACMLTQSTFKQTQLQYSRVRTAYTEKEDVVKNYFSQKQIALDGFQKTNLMS